MFTWKTALELLNRRLDGRFRLLRVSLSACKTLKAFSRIGFSDYLTSFKQYLSCSQAIVTEIHVKFRVRLDP